MIEINNVSFTYGSGDRECGLHDISLTVTEGEFLLLCGGSGCGKTTLTRLINGLIPHYYEGRLAGRVLVEGKDVTVIPLYETAELVGSVFQNPRSQFFNTDTTSELAFGCENMGLPENEILSRIKNVTEELELKPLLDKSIFALSGGEKQKIACGSAAAMGAAVFVLDEPSSNLDPYAVEDLRVLLAKWKRMGKTVVIAEHRLYYLRELIDRVIYMENGRITREYNAEEFSTLMRNGLDLMGLRTLKLESLFETAPAASTQSLKPGCKISLSQFQFCYSRNTEVLRIQQADLPRNQIIAVIGQNGAGKSTFARCLCGLERKCRGKVILDGDALTGRQLLTNCYMVMQDVNHQLFVESVLDEVLISMDREDIPMAEFILEGLDLLNLKDCHPMALSGGQKQRVAIASAIASGRQIIVFDEPTSGLDLKHMKEVAQNLRMLAAKGKSVFVVTHDPEFIFACCTHIIQIEDGRIVRNESLDSCGIRKTLTYFLESAGERRFIETTGEERCRGEKVV